MAMETTTIQGKVKSLLLESLVTEKAQKAARRISGYANKPVIDRFREVVDVEAFYDTMPKFMKNPVMLFMHSMFHPIGSWDKYELRDDGLWLSGTMVPNDTIADQVWNLAEHGALRGLSIGFRELDHTVDDAQIYHITKLELLETSVVTVPANQDALFTVDKGGKLCGIELIEPQEDAPKDKEKDQLQFEWIRDAVREAVTWQLTEATVDQSQQIDKLTERIDTLSAILTKQGAQLDDHHRCLYRFMTREIDQLAATLGLEKSERPGPGN
jgi:HK97 family phage prohead protease